MTAAVARDGRVYDITTVATGGAETGAAVQERQGLVVAMVMAMAQEMAWMVAMLIMAMVEMCTVIFMYMMMVMRAVPLMALLLRPLYPTPKKDKGGPPPL